MIVTHDAILPITTQGTTVVTWTYDDGNGNTSTQTQNVVIDDITPPAPDEETLPDVTDECEVTELIAPTATDNCGGTVIVTHDAILPITTQGTTVVIWTFDDGNGNTSTQTQNVVIDDVTAPVITGCPPATINAQTGPGRTTCDAIVTWTAPTATDNCNGNIIPVSSHNPGDVFPVGNTVVTYTFTDAAGNTTPCSFTVSVTDNTPPQIECPDSKVVLLSNATTCTGILTAEQIGLPTVSDNCTNTNDITISWSRSDGASQLDDPFALGTTTISWTATDANNNVSESCQQTITVEDRTAPVPNENPAGDLPTISGQCSVSVTTIPTATDNCAGHLSGSLVQGQFSYSTPGNYTIVWEYDDGHGNKSLQYQNLIVTGMQDFAITQEGSACNGGVTIGLAGSETGVSYQLIRFNGSFNTNVGAPLNGQNGEALSFGTFNMAGTYSVRATSIAEGCMKEMPGTFVINSAALPTAFMMTSTGSACDAGGVSISLVSSQANVTYHLIRTDNVSSIQVATLTSAVTGPGLNFGSHTIPGVYTIQAVNSAGCTNTMIGSVTITAGGIPTAYAMTSEGSACSGGVTIGLESSQSNTTYQLVRNGSINVGAPLAGNGNGLEFGTFTIAGTYTVVATSQAGCPAPMTGSVVVSAATLPTAYAISSTGSVCSGGVNILLAGSQANVNYSLIRTNGGTPFLVTTLAGNGFGLDFGTHTNAGIYTIQAESTTGGCINNMIGSVNIPSGSLPIAYAVTSTGSPCLGGVAVGLEDSEEGVNYQLILNGSTSVGGSVAGSGFAISFGLQLQGTYTVVATRSGGCSANMTGSVVIGSAVLPTVFTVTGGGSYCAGAGVPIGLSNSQVGVNYQLKRNGLDAGSPVPGTGAAISFGNQTDLGTYTAVAINATTACTNNMAGSASIVAGTVPTVFSVTGGGIDCSGEGISVGLSGSQLGINYQLQKDGLDIGGPIAGTGSAINFSPQTAGTYTVVATNATTACSSVMTGSVIITEGVLPIAAITNNTGTEELTCSLTSISVTATGGVSYSWNGGATPSSANNSFGAPGTYTVMVTGANGCTASTSITITKDEDVPTAGIINNSMTTELNCSTNSISVTATGGVSYSWNGGATPSTAENSFTAAGTYTVTVTGPNGCTSTESITISENYAEPVVVIGSNTGTFELDCNNSSLLVTGSGGGISYEWSHGLGNTSSVTITAPDTYTLTVTDANGCVTVKNVVVSENMTPPNVSITSSTGAFVIDCNNALLEVTASGGVSYAWSDGLGNAATATISDPGVYTVTVTGANGCTTTETVEVTEEMTPPSVTIISGTGVFELDCNNPSLQVTASGGVSYAWSHGLGNTATATITTDGTYTVTVTGVNGCTKTENVVVTGNSIQPTAGITNLTGTTVLNCNIASINVTATGGGTYEWSNGLGNSASAIITQDGTYTVTVTSDNGCTDTESIIITADLLQPTAGIVNNTGTTVLTCNTTSISVTATGGVTYAWSNGLGNSAAATIVAAGTYTVTVTGANGCTDTETITVTGNTATPVAGIINNTGTTVLSCTTSSILVTATGGGSYQWDGGLGSNASATIIAPGTYTVTVTGANGCTDTESITITQNLTGPATSIVNHTGTTILTCTTTAINVEATNGVSYQWNGGSNPNSAVNSFNLPGLYQVTVTGANGCTSSATINITQNTIPPPAAITNITGTTVLGCTTSAINVQATGGVSYLWNGGLGNSADATITSAGSYTVTVTGANGCTATANITVTGNSNPPVAGINNITGTTVLSCTTPTINVQATGGVSYQWNGGLGNSASATIVNPGTYTVVVTGANGCTSSESITVTGNNIAPVASISNNTGTTVLTCNTTSISVTASGGVSYAWSNGLGNSASATIIQPGTYTVTVTGANGCTDTESITVTANNTAPVASISNNTGTTVLTCNTTSISVTASGGVSYAWSNGLGNSASATIILPGTYTVTVTGANGCTDTESITVTGGNTPPTAGITNNTGTTELSCNTTSISVTATGGGTYAWSNGLGNSASATITQAGTYTVTVTGASGCTDTESITITGGAGVMPTVFNVTSTTPVANITQTLFQAAEGPGLNSRENDGSGLELGMKFKATQNGLITGIRYFKPTGTTGTHRGSLWTNTGTLLATALFSGETASGWQQVSFTTPVAITAGTTYVASYFSPSGDYASTWPYFNQAKTNGALRGLASGEDGLNGLYTYGTTSSFPTSSWNSSNYWVDVVFTTGVSGCTGQEIGLSGSQTGVNYQLMKTGSASPAATVAGTGAALNFGTQSEVGTYTVVAVNATSGCTSNMNGNAVITSAGNLPSIFNVTGGGVICNGSAPVGLSGSQVGVSYQLFRSGTASAIATVNGTGSAINFPTQNQAATYTVLATNTSTGCTSTMAGSVTITIGTVPTIYTVTGGGSLCNGNVAIGLSGSQNGVSYQLFRSGTAGAIATVSGTGSAISFPAQSETGTYIVVATGNTGCSNNMTGSAVVTAAVSPNLYTVTGGGSLCNGNVAIGLSGSQTGVSYQLFRSGTASAVATVNGTGSAINFPAQSQAGTYTVVATSNAGCVSNMTGSAVVTAAVVPNLYTVTGGGSLCNGNVAIGLSNSQSGVSYQLFRSGTASAIATVNGTGSAFSFPSQSVAGTYTVVATSNTDCSRTMTGSAVVTAAVSPNVYTVTGGGSLCNGNVAIGLSGSQSGVSYQLFRSGTASAVATVSGTGSAINFPAQSVAGTYTVVATNAGGCVSNMTGSAEVTAAVLPNLYTVTGGGSLCNGNVVVGLSGSQSGINYQLFRSGTASAVATVSGTGSAINFPAQSVAGTYTVVGTNTTTGCVRTMTGSASVTAGTLPNLYSVTSVQDSGPGATQTLFSAGEVPQFLRENDGTSLELGMKFRATVNGYITGIRYYKGPGTTGTHRGSLWSNTGALLATALFTSETASGWQQVLFTTPVAITAGTTYVASYFSPSGDYATTANYFATAKVNGNLRGLANGEDGANGLYRYSGTSAFPNLTWQSASYFVDVVFATSTASSCNVTVGLSGSQTGVNYQLHRNGIPGAIVAGTGSAISFGSQSISGTYTVVATNATTGCTRNMSGTASVSCTATKSPEPLGGETNLITKTEPEVEPLKLSISAYPNPSVTYFNVKVSSSVKETVELRMFDIQGKVIEVRRGAPDQVYRFGDGVAAGMYVIEARQGSFNKKATIKVVKQN